MFKKYYPPPDIKGRNLFVKNPLKEKGKKHYWGEPGKNYGFYTYQEEKDIVYHWKQHHRRGNSYSYANLETNNDPVQNIQKNTRSSFSQRINTQPQRNQKLYYQVCQKKNSQNQQVSQHRDLHNKWKQYATIQYGEEERKNKLQQQKVTDRKSSRNQLLSKNIDICLPKIQNKGILKNDKAEPQNEQNQKRDIQYQRIDQRQLRKNSNKIGLIVQNQLVSRSKTIDSSMIQREQQEVNYDYMNKNFHLKELQKRRKGNIFLMEPKLDRSYSPTYCNSINYPLPYFRHVK